MAVSGKKINELDEVTTLTEDSVLPAVVVNSDIPETTAKKVSISQLNDYIGSKVLPDQAGQAGKVLTTDGNTASWQTPAAGVTSVNGETGVVILTGEDISVDTNAATTIDVALENKQDKYTIITNADATSLVPLPNTIYDFGNTPISTLTISSYTKSYDETVIYFTSGVSDTAISLPTGLSWISGVAPTIEGSKKYVISICNGAVISGEF